MTRDDLFEEYRRLNWNLKPVPTGEKGPCERDWQLRDYSRADFEPDKNVGLILGPKSGETVDTDLDCLEALALAEIYLPATRAKFGRSSKPCSHWLYAAPSALFATFKDPIAEKKPTMLELRAPGPNGSAHQTIIPPSIADGERREWHDDVIDPAVIDPRVLRHRCAWLAIGCLTMRYVSEHAARRPGPDLPAVLWEADHALGRQAYHWLGQPAPDEPKHGYASRPRRELSAEEIDLSELVAAIPNGAGVDWIEWNRIGMAIFAASGGSDHGGIVFDDWSARSPSYNPYTTSARWNHYRRSPPSRTGVGALIKLGRQHGWRPPDKKAGI